MPQIEGLHLNIYTIFNVEDIGFGISSKTFSYNDTMNKTFSHLLSRLEFKYSSQKKKDIRWT